MRFDQVGDDAFIDNAIGSVDSDFSSVGNGRCRFDAAALGPNDTRNAQFAADDGSMAGHAAGISDDSFGFLHSRNPVGGGHGRNQDFAVFEFRNLRRIEDDVSFAGSTARTCRKAFYDNLAVCRHCSRCRSRFGLFFILLRPNRFRTSLKEPYLIGPFIDAPFHIHVAAVVFFNLLSILSQFSNLFIRNDLLFLQFRRNEAFFTVAAGLTD